MPALAAIVVRPALLAPPRRHVLAPDALPKPAQAVNQADGAVPAVALGNKMKRDASERDRPLAACLEPVKGVRNRRKRVVIEVSEPSRMSATKARLALEGTRRGAHIVGRDVRKGAPLNASVL